MQGVMHGKERSLLEMAALAYGAALSLALIIVVARIDAGSTAWWFCLAPVTSSVLAVATRARPIVWTAIGASLAFGFLSIFTMGLFLLQIAICLFLWWLLSSRRDRRPAFIASDLFWLAAGLDVVLLPLFVF
jgi:hypothetical protein